MSKRKTSAPDPHKATATEMAEFITREIRSLMVQARNNRRRLETLFWFSARLWAGIGQLKEHIKKLEGRP